MVLGNEASQTDDGAASVALPIRSEQAREGRHEVDAAAIGHGLGLVLNVLGGIEELEVITQPLHKGASDGDRAFKAVHGWFFTNLVTECGEQTIFALNRLGACVQKHEASGAI